MGDPATPELAVRVDAGVFTVWVPACHDRSISSIQVWAQAQVGEVASKPTWQADTAASATHKVGPFVLAAGADLVGVQGSYAGSSDEQVDAETSRGEYIGALPQDAQDGLIYFNGEVITPERAASLKC